MVGGFSPNKAHMNRDMVEISRQISQSLRRLLEPIAGANPKTGDIAAVLGLDRTQAWRIARAIEAEDPYLVLHEVPAPRGLSAIVDAAERAGADAAASAAAREAVSEFAALVHRFPDGRAGLDAALAARVPKALEAAQKAARKKIGQGMSQVLGLKAAVRYVASIVTPSRDRDDTCDVVAIAGYRDLRRLRIGPAPVVFSGRTYTQAPSVTAPALLTIDGAIDPDPRSRILEHYSSIPPDTLTVEQNGSTIRLVLAPDTPAVNEPVTMFFAQRIARTIQRWSSAERNHELIVHSPVLPADVNVIDTLIRDDVLPLADPPRLTVERFGFSPVAAAGSPDDRTFRIDEVVETATLGPGLGRALNRAVPRVGELLAEVLERSGEDPRRFRVYRSTQENAVPGFVTVAWCPLEARPG